jgi:hypothetical protein
MTLRVFESANQDSCTEPFLVLEAAGRRVFLASLGRGSLIQVGRRPRGRLLKTFKRNDHLLYKLALSS